MYKEFVENVMQVTEGALERANKVINQERNNPDFPMFVFLMWEICKGELNLIKQKYEKE